MNGIEVMGRRQCQRCHGQKGSYENSGPEVQWHHCICVTGINPAGAGYEVIWVKVEAPVTTTPVESLC